MGKTIYKGYHEDRIIRVYGLKKVNFIFILEAHQNMSNDTKNIEFIKLKTFLKGRYFLYSALTFCFLLISIGIYNVIYLFEVFRSNFLLFYPIIYLLIEVIRSAFIVWLVVLIIRFVISSRKNGYLDSLFLEKLVRLLAIGLFGFVMIFVILFWQVYLTHVFASIIFIALISLVTVFFIIYINRINAFPIDEGKPIPNPIVIVILLLISIAFLIFHYNYRTLGGNYSIFASRAYFFLAIPFVKYVLLILINFSMINLFLGFYFGSQNTIKKNYLYSISIASVILIALGLTSIIVKNQPNFVIDQYENVRDDPLSGDVMIFTKDLLIYPVDTPLSHQTWTGNQITWYNYAPIQWFDLNIDEAYIPSLTALDTVSLMIPDTAEIYDITVYDNLVNIIDSIDTWDELSELTTGNYAIEILMRNTTVNGTAIIKYVFVLVVK